MADNEDIANIISSLMSDKSDAPVSADEAGESIAVSISESLGKFFNRMRGPEQMSPVTQVGNEGAITDTAESPLISYLNTAFLPVLSSLKNQVVSFQRSWTVLVVWANLEVILSRV